MAHVSTPLTWSLDSTASTTISVFKDVMRAATSDNVQPLALIACEKFGATLAMCPETNKKMEDLIIKVSGPKHVRFMRAQIGYSANDSATQFSRSLAGIHFLGLAAVLTSSVDMFDGANTLSEMLMDSASDKTLLPTARQLKDLLVVMEHRLVRSGFTDMWVGYQILLSGGLRASSEQGRCKPLGKSVDLMQIPKSDGISNLVKAFGQLNRLGDATAITIQATSCAPWVMAFTRWCLGVPPSIILPNGEALLDQPASRVTLFAHNDAKPDALEISAQRSIGSPADLLKSQAVTSNFHGMITVECFGQNMCHTMGGRESMAYRAMCEALPYALKQSCELLQVFNHIVHRRILDLNAIEIADKVAEKKGEKNAEDRAARKDAILREQVAKYHTQSFPDDSIISSILTRILNLESHQYLKRLNDRQRISDLPLVREHLHELARGCMCRVCRERVMKSYREDASVENCDEMDRFWRQISIYAACILTLSLFEYPEMLLVSLSPYALHNQFLAAVHKSIQFGKPTVCKTKEILASARRLVGHKDSGDDLDWVVSSYKGQAVYPRVYETGDICQPGYLVLCWAPGLLFFDGEVYDRGMEPSPFFTNRYVTDPLSMQPLPPVTEPLNLLPKMKMEWKVVRRDGYLEVYPVCGDVNGLASRILYNLQRALILRRCPHDSASPLEKPDLFSRYTLPTTEGELSVKRGEIGVVAVDGDAGLRMFALSDSELSDFRHDDFDTADKDFVIRNNACLQCCLDLCRKARYGHVIC